MVAVPDFIHKFPCSCVCKAPAWSQKESLQNCNELPGSLTGELNSRSISLLLLLCGALLLVNSGSTSFARALQAGVSVEKVFQEGLDVFEAPPLKRVVVSHLS